MLVALMMLLKVSSLVVCFVLVINFISFAQEEKKEEPQYGWQNEVVGSLNLTQTSFDNWVQGGENSLAWQLNLNAKFVNNQEQYNWANTGKVTYGRTKVGDVESRKSIDEIKLESVFTYKMNLYVNPYILGLFWKSIL